MSQQVGTIIAVIGIDIGKNSFHVVGLDQRGAIVLRQRWSRGQVESRLANMPSCLIGMEACVGAHHLSRKLKGLGHDARLMPAKYVRPYPKGRRGQFVLVLSHEDDQWHNAIFLDYVDAKYRVLWEEVEPGQSPTALADPEDVRER
jgi:hypothetical protein